ARSAPAPIRLIGHLLFATGEASSFAPSATSLSLPAGGLLSAVMLLAITFILMAAGYRIVGAWNPDLVNFSPLMALAFCGAIYFRNRLMWLVPFVALIASDFYLNRYYAA